MTRALTGRAIPADIQRTLAAMLFRARLVALFRGLAAVVATLLTAVLLAIGADHFLMGYVERYIIIYEWPVRLAVTLGILAAAGLVTALAVVRPLIRRFSDSGIAQTIEQYHPELEERLSSTVELLASNDPEILRGSDEMVRIVTDQARAGVRRLSLRGIVSWDRAARHWAVTALIGLAVGVIAYRWPEPFMLSLRRLFIANLERVGQTDLAILGEGDRVVPEDEPLLIQAEARGQPIQKAWLLIRREDDRLRTMEMSPTGDQASVFACTIARAHGTWRYQVRAGDSHTRWFTVTAVPRPAMVGLEATITPPAYSGRKPRTLASMPDVVELLRHSRIDLRVRTNKPIATGIYQFEHDRSIDVSPDDQQADCYKASVTALHDTSFRVLLADEHKLDNLSPARYRIRVVPDEPPSVSITQPGRRVTLKAKDKLPIRFLARDDLGISKAELIVGVGVDEPVVLPIELPRGSNRRIETQTILDLATVGAELARQVTYRVRVSDSLPSALDNGPQTTLSAEHEIMVDAGAQSFQLQILQSVRKQFKTAIDQIGKLLETSEKQTAALKTDAAKKQELSENQQKQTEAVRKDLRKAEKLAHDIRELTSYTDYRRLGEMLSTDIAQRHIAPAEQLITQGALLPDQHAERADRFGRAEFEIQRARENLAKLAKQFDDTAVYQETAQLLADSAARQAELADRIQKLAESDLQRLQGLADANMPAASQPGQSLESQGQAHAAGARPSSQPQSRPSASRPAAPVDMARLTKEQQELIKATQGIIAAHPELWQPVLELQESRSKTLLEQLADLVKRQEALIGFVKEQETRDKARAQRQELAKGQAALTDEVARLARDLAALLQQAGVSAPQTQPMASASTMVQNERFDQAAALQSQTVADLDRIIQTAGNKAKELAKTAPDPKPHEQLANTGNQLAKEAAALAQSQRQLAAETGNAAKQRSDHQQALAQVDVELQQQMDALKQRQDASLAETSALLDKIRKHPRLSKELSDALKKSEATAKAKQAAGSLAKKRPDQAAPAQQAAAKSLDDVAKAIQAATAQTRQEAQRVKTETDRWNADEAKRVEAVKAYQAEQARRKDVLDKWQAAEAKRKADLAKWTAEQQARLKAAATQAAKSPATTQPTTTQAVAKAPAQEAPPPEPPKELATPIAEPKFPALAKPGEKPAPKPQPKRALWDDAELKSADALVPEAAAIVKRLSDLHANTANAAQQAKQQQDQRSAAQTAAGRQDEELLKRQQQLRTAAAQLVSRGAKAVPELANLPEPASPIPPMQEAAKGIKQHELASVARPQLTAAERLEALARTLSAESAKATAAANDAKKAADEAHRQAQAQQELAKLAQQMKQKQDGLHKQTAQLAKRLAPLGPHLGDKLVADLLRQQESLAKEASELSDQLARPQQADGLELPAKPNPVAESAAMQAKTTALALNALSQARSQAGTDNPAADAAKKVTQLQSETAGRLDQLAQHLQEPIEQDPARWEQQAIEEYLRVQQAERAAELADRQRRLAKQLEQVTSGKPMQAVAVEQAKLCEKVADFAQAAEFLAEQVEAMEPKIPAIKPQILANAKKATELLAKAAPEAMAAAAKQLRADQAGPAIQPMTDAGKHVAQAGKLLGTLQAQFAKAAGETPATRPSDEELSRQLTESLEDQYEALRRMLEAQEAAGDASTDPADALAQAMRDKLRTQAARAAASANAARMQASAREFLEAAWQAAGETNIDPDRAVILPGAPTGLGNWRIVIPDSKILDLELVGLTRSDWARLPDTLREEVIQAAEDKSPAEYREVIKRYFKAISQRAGANGVQPLLDDTAPAQEAPKPDAKTKKK